jgi:ABC-type proline/glycine betaine transport system ATPase subunit
MDASFTVERGEIFVIMGLSGAASRRSSACSTAC